MTGERSCKQIAEESIKRRDSMMVVVLLHNVRCYSDPRVIELNLGRVQAATELASRSK